MLGVNVYCHCFRNQLLLAKYMGGERTKCDAPNTTFSKNGKLLKQIFFRRKKKIQGRWYPITFIYKNVLKNGKGTKMTIESLQLDTKIPETIFNKANLK